MKRVRLVGFGVLYKCNRFAAPTRPVRGADAADACTMNCGRCVGISGAFNRRGSSGDAGLRSRFLISLLPDARESNGLFRRCFRSRRSQWSFPLACPIT